MFLTSCDEGAPHRPRRIFPLAIVLLFATIGSLQIRAAEFVIHISVDGLNASVLQSIVDAGLAPNFKRFEDEGAWTLNARADYTYTTTLPNHVTILTGRPVLVPEGLSDVPFHGWTNNSI